MKVSETNRNFIQGRVKQVQTDGRFCPMQRLLHSAASLKTVLRILFAVSMLLISLPVTNGTSRKFELTSDFTEPNENAVVEDATFEKVWVEHDVKVDGKKGMRIHTSFIVKNNLNVVCTLVAHFYKREGAQLEGADLQGDYSTSDGHVVTYVEVTPRFNSTRYSDKTLFIPYQEFHLKTPGLYLLKFIVFLERHDNNQILAKSAEFNFKYTKS